MLLRCHHAFGNCAPGDEVEVPDGAAFDQAYFEKAEEPEHEHEFEAEHEVAEPDQEGNE
jgi:hypothetical protein